MHRILLAFLLLLAMADAAAAATLTVDVRDARGAAVVDAVVYAVPEGHELPAPARRVSVMDQRNRMFVPHVLPIQTGTAVRFPNSDDIRHQVYSFSSSKSFTLPLYKGTPSNPIVFDRAGVVTLGCNIHDRMSAYIVVVDTPYFATSDGKGPATLANVSAGRYVVHVWHPYRTVEPGTIAVTVGARERKDLQFAVR
jgi:plastocyanin